jgi:hypothetical protein
MVNVLPMRVTETPPSCVAKLVHVSEAGWDQDGMRVRDNYLRTRFGGARGGSVETPRVLPAELATRFAMMLKWIARMRERHLVEVRRRTPNQGPSPMSKVWLNALLDLSSL